MLDAIDNEKHCNDFKCDVTYMSNFQNIFQLSNHVPLQFTSTRQGGSEYTKSIYRQNDVKNALQKKSIR